jgi:hypothetical protein
VACENATTGVKLILQQALCMEATHEIEMQGSMIHGDRGYNDDKFLCFCSSINASVLFTVKRRPTLPFSFGSTGYRSIQDQQQMDVKLFSLLQGKLTVRGYF